MKYVHRDLGDAAEASNPGPAGMRREIAFLIGATAALFLAAYFAIGWAVELVLPRISVERERAWFGQFSLAAHATTPEGAEESARFARAQATLARLIAQPGVPALDYKLVFVSESRPNAFAFPGGTIAITRGMLQLLEDEVSTAFVLGHELGHFAQRDHLRGLGRALGRAIAWTLVFGDMGDVLTRHAGTLLDLAHARQQESGADRFGLELVHRVYGRTEGTERLFVWLDERQRQPAWAVWLQSHPDPGNRVQRLQERARELDAKR